MRWIISLIMYLYFITFVIASDVENFSLLENSAHDFISENLKPTPGDRVDFSITLPDSRLRLPFCDIKKIRFFFPNGQNVFAARSLGVECNDTQRWTVYLDLKISVFTKIAVVTQNINQNNLIDESNVALIERNRVYLKNGYFTSLDVLKGMVAKSTIIEGTVLTKDIIKPQTIIMKGDAVTITVVSGNLRVEMAGVALGSGGAGESIAVLNSSSKRIVEAIIRGPNKVEVL